MHFKIDFSDELSTSVQDSAANLYTQQVKPEDQSLWIKPEDGIFWVLHCYLAFTVNYSSYYPSKKCSFIFARYSYLLSLIAWLTLIISLGNSVDVKEESLKTITLLENKISLAVWALKPLHAIIPSLMTSLLKICLLGLQGQEQHSSNTNKPRITQSCLPELCKQAVLTGKQEQPQVSL